MIQPKLRSLIPLLFHIALISPLFYLSTAGLLFAAEPVSTKAPKGVCIQPLDGIPLELSASEEAEVDKMVLPVPKNWIGDFDGIRKRRYIRILVPNSKTFFSVDRGTQQGIEYEFGKALEKWINQKYPSEKKSRQLHVFFIPVKRDQLLPYLLAGKGDVAAGGLTVTPGRKQMVDFTIPMTTGVREALVTGLDFPKVNKLEDLSGKEITVRASSSYFEHLVSINARLREQGLPPIKMIAAADEWLESEDLLEMVNAGCIQATVVDRYLAQIWQPLFNNMKIEDNFYINDAGDLAWAIRKGSPKLEAALNSFMNQHKVGTLFGNMVVNRYVKNSKRVVNENSTEEIRKFTQLVGLFKSHGKNYGFDYLMLMAQGYQESMLNQKATSSKGAVGIMQLLPATATDPAINIRGIDKDPGKNIEAGTKYLRLLTDKYLNDKELTPVNKTLMAFAAYNAGPGNLRKFRRLAEKSGNDPNIWFQNVEYAAAQIIGKETVNYVANIYKYYLAYKLISEKDEYSKGKEITLEN
jgi:membrane-bound lytic murein transglycosylase MltF